MSAIRRIAAVLDPGSHSKPRVELMLTVAYSLAFVAILYPALMLALAIGGAR